MKFKPPFLLASILILGNQLVFSAEFGLELATEKGCFTCHTIQHEQTTNKPLAPSYQSIAERYRDSDSAFEYLTNRILHGTLYREQNWSDSISMRFMPPNVNVSRIEAAELTNWIVNLPVDEALRKQLQLHEEMLILVTRSGCTACHLMDASTDSRLMPLAPAFRKIAERYRNDPEAEQQLTRSIINGTRSATKLWPEVNMQFMPPNLGLSKENAGRLSRWILDL